MTLRLFVDLTLALVAICLVGSWIERLSLRKLVRAKQIDAANAMLRRAPGLRAEPPMGFDERISLAIIATLWLTYTYGSLRPVSTICGSICLALIIWGRDLTTRYARSTAPVTSAQPGGSTPRS